MPTSLKESYIENVAINYLKEYYYFNCSHNNKIQYQQQAYTIDNKRADGIIFWEKTSSNVRLVSIEAKSAKTIRNLKSRWDKEKLSETSLILAEIAVLVLFALLYSQFLIRLPLDGPLLFLILFFVYLFRAPLRILLQNIFASYFKTASVFEQVNLYPGNEVWIAIGDDTFKKNRAQRLKEFIEECKRRKLGLLEIPPEGYKPRVLLHPKFKPIIRRKDFLEFYKKDAIYRQAISGPSSNFLFRINSSKAEIQFYRNQFLYAMGIVFSLFLYTTPFDDLYQQTKSTKTIEKISFVDKPKKVKMKPAVVVEEILNKPITTPTKCNFPFEGEKFIIKDKVVTSYEDAKERVSLLKNMGFPHPNYFYIPCSNIITKQEAWCIYAYNPRSSEEKAIKNFKRYKYILKKNNIDASDSKIWHVGRG